MLLKKYIRGKHGERRGLVVAVKIDGKIGVGYSCKNSRLEKSDRPELALKIAEGRAIRDAAEPYTIHEVPHPARAAVIEMAGRASRYFRDAQPRKFE